MAENDSKSSLGFLFGILAGIGLTLLFTTPKGKVLRKKIQKGISGILEEFGEFGEIGEEKADDWEPKALANETGKESKTVSQETEKKEEVIPHVKEIQERGRRFFFRRPRAN